MDRRDFSSGKRKYCVAFVRRWGYVIKCTTPCAVIKPLSKVNDGNTIYGAVLSYAYNFRTCNGTLFHLVTTYWLALSVGAIHFFIYANPE